jgi:hypothetical protein
MTYTKPELNEAGPAIRAIECTGQKRGGPQECGEFLANKTSAAYEADE